MIRFAEKKGLKKVNELRRQVNQVHVNGRPDIFRAEFCSEMQDLIYSIWENENKDIIVAVRDNIICGFACVRYITKPESPYSLERKFYEAVGFRIYRRYMECNEL